MEEEVLSEDEGEEAYPVSDKLDVDKWLVDSGAFRHMTYRGDYFTRYQPFSE